MYPPPTDSLDEATVRALDDQLFTSDPFAYIRSRLASLATERNPALTGSVGDEFAAMLGPSAGLYTGVDERVLKLQVAVDAFALRHQVAETLLRFLHVVLHHRDGCSYWVELIDTPIKTSDELSENHARLTAEGVDTDALLRSLLLMPGVEVGDSRDKDIGDSRDEDGAATESVSGGSSALLSQAIALHVAWINYAILIFTQRDPDLDAAHNKFNHGMGLRPQDDVLSTVTSTAPTPAGMPLSALSGDAAVNLFDGITTEFLARPSRRYGLEATQMAMMPAPTLVEAAAMAHTLALLFHTAATNHFQGRDPLNGRVIPSHPGLMVNGPRPGALRSVRPFALRFPLTTPLRDPKNSDALLFWTNGRVNTLRFGEPMHLRVFDDSTVFATAQGDSPEERVGVDHDE